MYRSLLLAAAAIVVTVPLAAQPGAGGPGGGPGGAAGQPKDGPGPGAAPGAARGPERAPGLRADAARLDRGPGGLAGVAGGPERGPRGGPGRDPGPAAEGGGPDRLARGFEPGPRGNPGPGPGGEGPAARGGPPDAGPAAGPRGERLRFGRGGRWLAKAEPVITGCPPGPAGRGPGCRVPATAYRVWDNGDRWSNWYGDWDGYRRDSRYDYRYADGYLYQVDPGTSLISGFLPLLGGGLFTGNSWPATYGGYEVPTYYDDYYGWDDGLDYRYADGAIFGVDPGSNRIKGIAGLLSGSDWNVGAPMPAGYDLYNLPPQYRDRWVDGPDHLYRYDDGYVYQVDPKTRLIQQILSLVA